MRDQTYYEVVYPGKLLPCEEQPVREFINECEKIEQRGPVHVPDLISGKISKQNTVGIGPVLHVTEEMLLYNAKKYMPDNPLFTDRSYAEQTKYGDIIAMTAFAAYDDAFMAPFPTAEGGSKTVCGLNHSIRSLRPIYPGDDLYMVVDERHYTDLTPSEGSIFRTCAIQTKGSIYNQQGEKVNEVIFRVRENMRYLKDINHKPEGWKSRMSPNWQLRPAHKYTDADWEKIEAIWKQETVRGAQPLYWEDVSVGQRMPETLDGPVGSSTNPTWPYGMGVGGTRTLKQEYLNPETRKSLVRWETDGIYRLPDPNDAQPPVPPRQERPAWDPDPFAPPPGAKLPPMPGGMKGPGGPGGPGGTPPVDPERRSIFINYLCRDLAVRNINSWMGDDGWIETLRWGLDVPEVTARQIHRMPDNPEAEDFFSHLPSMSKCYATAHGLTGDVVIIKSEIYDKYARNQKHYIELTWWAETIDGYIIEQGAATVRLPSRYDT
jgi:acyl dehydratase